MSVVRIFFFFFCGQKSLVFLFSFISFLIRKQDELVKGDGGFQTEVGVSLCLGRIISCGRVETILYTRLLVNCINHQLVFKMQILVGPYFLAYVLSNL